eukprot:4530558-Alexandrium_andersonii.AAC.1
MLWLVRSSRMREFIVVATIKNKMSPLGSPGGTPRVGSDGLSLPSNHCCWSVERTRCFNGSGALLRERSLLSVELAMRKM